jgi:hypothetical protein
VVADEGTAQLCSELAGLIPAWTDPCVSVFSSQIGHKISPLHATRVIFAQNDTAMCALGLPNAGQDG